MTRKLTFKDSARHPAGVTPEQIMSELDEIELHYGKRSPEMATEAILKEPDRFPALLAFCPASPEAAYKEAVRNAVRYAVRIIVEVNENDPDPAVEIRALHVVTDKDGDHVWEPLTVIARNEDYRLQLFRELEQDAKDFARKQRTVLAEIRTLLG